MQFLFITEPFSKDKSSIPKFKAILKILESG